MLLQLAVFRSNFFKSQDAPLNILDMIVVLIADIDLFLWILVTYSVG